LVIKTLDPDPYPFPDSLEMLHLGWTVRNLSLPEKPVEDKHEEIIRWSPIEYPRLQPQTTKQINQLTTINTED
jgi:hypothetical protein